MFKVDKSNPRAYTCALLQMVDDGVLDKDQLIQDLLGWLSEHEVQEFVRRNDYLCEQEEDEDCDPADDFNWVGSRHHY
jgi:hypothetical protein